MAGIGRRLRRQVFGARRVEGFVRLIVAGGLALLAGLWIARLVEAGSTGWWAGVGLVLLGIGGLARGIWSQVEY